MALQVLDENQIVRTIPEVSEVGARIEERVQANMPADGEDGKDGLSIWETTTNTTTGTTSISISTLNTVEGRSVQVGDYIIGNATYSYLYRVTAVNSTTVTVTYRRTLRGATGAQGPQGPQGEPGESGESNITVDSALSSTSENPVQNKVINTALSGKAPTSHASSATTYGVGNSSYYGHVKLSDSTSSTSSTTGGFAATPKAISDAISTIKSAVLCGIESGTGTPGNCTWAAFNYKNSGVLFGICAWSTTVTSTTQNIYPPLVFYSSTSYIVLAHRVATADYMPHRDTVKRVSGSVIQMPYSTGSSEYHFIAVGRLDSSNYRQLKDGSDTSGTDY